jgi:hypothetical protein
MKTKLHPDFSCPKGLTKSGRAAYRVILALIRKHDLVYSGGCKVFYSPKEWRLRGEEYGTSSELIVVYDGGAHRELFEPEYSFSFTEELTASLRKSGLWFEPCTCWYSAIYIQ